MTIVHQRHRQTDRQADRQTDRWTTITTASPRYAER